jgi:hypothetical protein
MSEFYSGEGIKRQKISNGEYIVRPLYNKDTFGNKVAIESKLRGCA